MRETLYVSTKGNIDIVPRRVSGYKVYPSLNEAARTSTTSLHVVCVREYKICSTKVVVLFRSFNLQ